MSEETKAIRPAAPPDNPGPADVIEAQVMNFWGEVLETRPDGTNTDFFQCGGSSLSAVLLINKLYEVYRVKIGFFEFFKIATVKKISDFIKAGVG